MTAQEDRALLAELRSQLKNESDLQQRTKLEYQILFLLSVTEYSAAIRREVRKSSARIVDLTDAANPARSIRQEIARLAATVNELFETTLSAIAEDRWRQLEEGYGENASPELLRATYGVAVDAEGNLVPQPGEARDPGEGATLEQILLAAAALLFVSGRAFRRPPRSQPDFDGIVNASRAESAPWRRKLAALFANLDSPSFATAVAIQADNGASKASIRSFVSSTLGTGEQRGLSQQIEGELSHEARRVATSIQRAFDEGNEAYVGWTMRSRFLPTSQIEHMERDGWKFYRDDRPGSTRPWSEQDQWYPPYRKNCVCYAEPIFESNLQDGSESLGIESAPRISPRSLPHWDDYFSGLPPESQREILGDRVFFAALSAGQGLLRWSHVTRGGNVMGPVELVNESLQDRGNRIAAENSLFEELRRRYGTAWAENDYRLSPAEELAMRRAIESSTP